MKPLICILAAALLSASVWAQESKPLTYTAEINVPGLDAGEVYDRICKWSSGAGTSDAYGFRGAYPDVEAKILSLDGHVKDYLHGGALTHDYSFGYVLNLVCLDEKLVVEMTDIHGQVDGNALDKNYLDWSFMTEGPEGIRSGLFASYWRRHDRILRGYLQEFFDQLVCNLTP